MDINEAIQVLRKYENIKMVDLAKKFHVSTRFLRYLKRNERKSARVTKGIFEMIKREFMLYVIEFISKMNIGRLHRSISREYLNKKMIEDYAGRDLLYSRIFEICKYDYKDAIVTILNESVEKEISNLEAIEAQTNQILGDLE